MLLKKKEEYILKINKEMRRRADIWIKDGDKVYTSIGIVRVDEINIGDKKHLMAVFYR